MAIAYFRGPTGIVVRRLLEEKDYEEFMKSDAVREQIIAGRAARKAAGRARRKLREVA